MIDDNWELLYISFSPFLIKHGLMVIREKIALFKGFSCRIDIELEIQVW